MKVDVTKIPNLNTNGFVKTTGSDGSLSVDTTTYSTTDEKVKYDAADPTAGYVADKIISGTGISVAEGTGGDENKLVVTNSAPDQTVAITAGTGISVSGTYPNFTVTNTSPDTDALVKVSANDTTAGYLNGKLVAGTGVTLTENNDGVNETLTVATTITQYTDELAQDAVGNAVGNGLDYDDTSGAISVDETELDHNALGSKQGGTTNEYYHLTAAQHTVVGNTSGTNTGDQDLSGYALTSSLGALAYLADVTTSEIDAATLVTEADTITLNDNDTTIPTSAAVKDYVDDTLVGLGAGDVVGPGSSVDGNITLFDGITGKIIKDAGKALSAYFEKAVDDTDDISEGATNKFDKTVALTAGTGISTSGTYPNFTITNSSPDQTVSISGTTNEIETSGTYPNFTVGIPNDAEIDINKITGLTSNGFVKTSGSDGTLSVDTTTYIPSSEKAAANGVATLDAGGKIPVGQLPALPTTDVFTVASEAAMLALAADQGDIAIRTDVSQSFILSTNSPGTLADWIELAAPAVSQFGYIRFTVGDGDNVITAGTKNYVAQIPYAGTITGWYITETSPTPIAGSIVVDVWKDTTGNYPPTVADTIAGTEKPTLSSAKTNSDTSLSTWTTSVSVGDCIGFTVDSNTDCRRVTVLLKILKS